MNKELFVYAVFPLTMFLIGMFGGKYVTEANLAYKYQDITPTSTITVDYDTYRCKLQEKSND